ncbi:MAG: hypothetical protein ACRDV1_14250 [Actinomycetes bacterium]
MTNVKPGYWDVDLCSWVGVDPMYVVPPLRHADQPHDRAVPTVPEPRVAAHDEPVTTAEA